MKVALCFIISYDHKVNKEDLWIEWISQNSDLFNIYFHYKDPLKITSPWIRKHAIPYKYTMPTDYLHCVPAYFALMYYASIMDKDNQWFCFLTESCVPIISPIKFREMFLTHYNHTFIKCQPIWWNTQYSNRANLKHFPVEYHLANSPWFVLTRTDVDLCFKYVQQCNKEYHMICRGDVANESVFAIILGKYGRLRSKIYNENTTITDWNRMTSPTSPYVFHSVTSTDRAFIENYFKENRFSMFLRKIHADYPDELLKEIIYKKTSRNMVSPIRMFYLNGWFFCKKILGTLGFFKYVIYMFFIVVGFRVLTWR
jgi:hypothetical protein